MESNEKLIRSVFASIAEFKPSLNKFAIVDDDDFEDEVDIRILGDQIIKSFPWPIGVEIRRLLSGSCRTIDRQRLDQIFKTAERTMQFFGFVLLSQLYGESNGRPFDISEAYRSQFKKRVATLSLGNFIWLISETYKVLRANNREIFTDEFVNVAEKEFFKRLDSWGPLRNEISHYQVNMPLEDVERKCIESEELLIHLLSDLAFLVNYRLISIRQIQVIKLRNVDPTYLHVINLLNNSDSDFKGKNIEENIHTASNAVILAKDLKDLRNYLNLSPLIIDTHSETINSRDKFHLRKDVFLYSKCKNDHLMYVGTETTEKCDLRALSNYNYLVSEFNDSAHHAKLAKRLGYPKSLKTP